MKTKELIIGVVIGFVFGSLIAALLLALPHGRDRYSLQAISGETRVKAVKMDRKTGETWQMDVWGSWSRSTNAGISN